MNTLAMLQSMMHARFMEIGSEAKAEGELLEPWRVKLMVWKSFIKHPISWLSEARGMAKEVM